MSIGNSEKQTNDYDIQPSKTVDYSRVTIKKKFHQICKKKI